MNEGSFVFSRPGLSLSISMEEMVGKNNYHLEYGSRLAAA